MTLYELDHLVHFVEKPEHMPDIMKNIGLHTVEGGKHEMWGTYNSLCYLGLSYIEFIGIFDEQLFEKSSTIPYTIHATYKNNGRKNGFTRIAFRTKDIEKDARKFRSLGLEVDGPTSFSRTRPDGTVVKWKLLHIGKEKKSFDYPFFIQWEEPNKERYKMLVNNGTIKKHDLGPLTMKEIHFTVEDLHFAIEWATLFDLPIQTVSSDKLELKGKPCIYTFRKETRNSISKVVIGNSKIEKDILLENGFYQFTS